MPAEVSRLAGEILQDPVRVEVTPVASTVDKVEQRLIFVDGSGKRGVLAELLRGEGVGRALVFTRTKHGADKVVKNLAADGIQANAIHGNKGQSQRERALAEFRTGRAPVLVATDIAARGIDVDGVTHVIQHDMPDTAEAYVHRIGRTARAGATGIAIALCAEDEREKLQQVEKLIRLEIPSEDRRSDVSQNMRRMAGRPDAVKPAVGRGRPQQQRRPQQAQGQRRDGHRPAHGASRGSAQNAPRGSAQNAPRGSAQNAPRGSAHGASRGGDAPVRRPTAAPPQARPDGSPEGRKDRNWRDGDFRDGGDAPAFLRRG
jgi:ATP-dependent RNA helicase RhlE